MAQLHMSHRDHSKRGLYSGPLIHRSAEGLGGCATPGRTGFPGTNALTAEPALIWLTRRAGREDVSLAQVCTRVD